MQFRPVDGSRVNAAAAQRSGEIVYELAKNGTTVTAETFLMKAKKEPKTSPIVSYFKSWNTRKSAEAFWLEQARLLMRSFTVVTIEEGEPVERRGAYFVPGSKGYVVTSHIRKSEAEYLSLVAEAERQAVSYYRRFSTILRLSDKHQTLSIARILRVIEVELRDEIEGKNAAE